jgi:anti-sigma B factor antagonist
MGVFRRLRPGSGHSGDPEPADLLDIAVERGPSLVRLRVRGEVDLYTAPLLSAALAQAMVGDAALVVIDLDEVTFMASSGLRVLLEGVERARHHRCELRLAGRSAAVRRLVEAAGMRGALPGL